MLPHRHIHRPRNVRLFLVLYKRRLPVNDATLAWQASPSQTVTSYSVVWQFNGTNQPAQTVARTAAQDAAGYTLDAATSNPGVTIQPGDVVDATITAVDATHNLSSAPVTPPPVTEPIAPPAPPQNVTLVLA